MASTRKDKYKELRSTIEEENKAEEVKVNAPVVEPKKKKVNLEDLDLDFLDEKNNEIRPSEKLKKEQEQIYSTMEMKKIEVADNKAAKVLNEVTEKRPSKDLGNGTIIFKRVDNVSSEEKEKSQKRFVKESKKIDEQATRQISVKEVLDRSVKLDRTTKFDRMKNIKKDEKYQENNPAILILSIILVLAIVAIVLIVIATL